MEVSSMKKEKIHKSYEKLLAFQTEHPNWNDVPLERNRVDRMKRSLRSFLGEVCDAANVTRQYITDTVTLHSLPDYIKTQAGAESHINSYVYDYQEIKLQKRGDRWMAFCIRGE